MSHKKGEVLNQTAGHRDSVACTKQEGGCFVLSVPLSRTHMMAGFVLQTLMDAHSSVLPFFLRTHLRSMNAR